MAVGAALRRPFFMWLHDTDRRDCDLPLLMRTLFWISNRLFILLPP